MKRRVTTDIHIYKITNRINGKVYVGQTWTALNENVQTNSIAECKAEDELPLE